jgi:acyl-CoA dehydrogenase
VHDRFLQEPPRLPNSWTSDRILRDALRNHLGVEAFALAEHELAEMGAAATSDHMLSLAARAEREPPQHVPYAPWGLRIDDIRVSDAYLELGRVGVKAGVTALPYEKTLYEDRARLVWAGLIVLWGPSSALYSCPVAMTDGAARTLIEHAEEDAVEAVARLTSRDPDFAWTSGQWMTETSGGSDISRTATIARRVDDDTWRLWGTKWFTSSTTSEMALTLARPEVGAPATPGSSSLALFRVERMLPSGEPNAIIVRRLKDKLGTRALPTAELELEGAVAYPVGDPAEGGGVRRIATMLNVTRIHNALGSAGSLARGLAWARSHAQVREVFGSPLHTMPAHKATLADLAVDYSAALALVLRCCELLGRVEHGTASPDEAVLLRGLTPIAKAATARLAVAGVAEAMEAIGGVGYCEDSTIPTLVRDTHVQPIWEGTTNVLSLDFLRAARAGALEVILEEATESARMSAHAAVADAARAVSAAVHTISKKWDELADDEVRAQSFARSLALGVATTYACAHLCRQGAGAAERGDGRVAAVASRLAARGLLPPGPPLEAALAAEADLI